MCMLAVEGVQVVGNCSSLVGFMLDNGEGDNECDYGGEVSVGGDDKCEVVMKVVVMNDGVVMVVVVVM